MVHMIYADAWLYFMELHGYISWQREHDEKISYVYIYIYTYVCIYLNMYTYIYIYIYIDTYTFIRIHILMKTNEIIGRTKET